MPAFESLQGHKNKMDAQRRQSMSDQQAKGGIFSQLFHKLVLPLYTRHRHSLTQVFAVTLAATQSSLTMTKLRDCSHYVY